MYKAVYVHVRGKNVYDEESMLTMKLVVIVVKYSARMTLIVCMFVSLSCINHLFLSYMY